MNRFYTIVVYLLVLISHSAVCQNPWTQKANFPGGARGYTSEFTIGHYAFVGLGNNGNSFYDFYKWNGTTNTWSAIPNYPGVGSYDATAFTIEGKGYVCLGWTGSYGAKDMWRYDTITNAWTPMATFPGVGRYDAQAFVIGHKAYIIAGSINGPPYLQDVWVYDAHQNTWAQKANWPGGLVEETISFAIGNHGYIGDGWYPGCTQQMFEYDTATDTWKSIANIPIANGITEQPDTWVSGSRAYLCTGAKCNAAGLRDGWMYDTVTKNWCEFNYIAASRISRGNGVAFSINNHGYMCTGQDTNLHYLNDLWEYTPSTKINVKNVANSCVGDSAYFSDSSSYIASAWSWLFPGGSPASSNLQNPIVYYSKSGIYTATLILTACGGNDTVSRTITVTSGILGNIYLNGRRSICTGTPDTLTISGGGTYKWSNGATTSSIIVTPNSNSTYSVSIVNGNCQKDTSIQIMVSLPPSITLSGNDSVCSGTSTTLSVSGGSKYLWSTGATTNSISVSPMSTSRYSVSVSKGGCWKDTTLTVYVKPTPDLVLSSSTYTICSGDSLALHVSGANIYSWSPSNGLSCTNCPNPVATPIANISYFITGYNTDGCTDEKSITILVNTSPKLAAIPNQNTCPGGQVSLTANVLSGFGGTFNWQPGGLGTASIIVSPNSTTTYTSQYTNACGTISTQVTVFVQPQPVPYFATDVTTGCAPFCVQYKDLSSLSAGKIIEWRWAFGNGDTLDEESPIFCYLNTGTFTTSLTTMSDNGCTATLKIVNMISVYTRPVANFTYSPKPIGILYPTVQFTDESTDIYGIAYRWWTFGDEGTDNSNSLDPSHTYQDTGVYCPQLVVMNNKGCMDTITNCLFVAPLYTLYIPSAFSPNRDGLNDVFEAKGTYIKSFEMYIFDRWGMELFHSTSINQGWDGTVNGSHVVSQEDSYVYAITVTDWDNTQHSYTGEVTLLK